MSATLGTTAPTGTLQTEAVQVGTSTRSAQLPALDPTPPFLMYSHPNRWGLYQVDGEWELLPSLAEIPVEAGVAGTDHRGDPSVGIAQRTTRRGWRLIPEAAARPQDTADGRSGYVRLIRARKGAHHCTAWTDVRMVGTRQIIRAQTNSYCAWLRSLLDRGLVDQPDPAIVEGLLDAARDRLARAGRRDLKNNDYARQLFDEGKARVAALEAVLARLMGEDADLEGEGVPVASAAVEVETKTTRRRSKAGA